jgi:hypothetical protein
MTIDQMAYTLWKADSEYHGFNVRNEPTPDDFSWHASHIEGWAWYQFLAKQACEAIKTEK